jgi:hypothetical protein
MAPGQFTAVSKAWVESSLTSVSLSVRVNDSAIWGIKPQIAAR